MQFSSSDIIFKNITVYRETVLILNELGVPPNLLGRKYMTYAMALLFEEKTLKLRLTTWLYTSLRDIFKTSTYAVDHALRTAIKATWERGNKAALREHFGYYEYFLVNCPTNSEFLARLRELIKLRIINISNSQNDSIA